MFGLIIKTIYYFFSFKKIKCPFCKKVFRGVANEEESTLKCPYCKKIWGL